MTPTAAELRTWGLDTLEQIQRDHFLPARGLYAQKGHLDHPDRKRPASVWAAAVQLSALALAARFEPSWREVLRRYADGVHRAHHRPGNGYSARVKSGPKDHFYDDNAWLALAFLEIAETLADDRYLVRAQQAMAFVLSGEDDTLGGGIYWSLKKKDRKNTCVAAPAALAAARLYKKTNDNRYLHDASRLIAWLDETLQDPDDGLLWDHIRGNGQIDRTKRSYNTALYLAALAEMPQRTKINKKKIRRLARKALNRWYRPRAKTFHGTLPFLHHLSETLLRLDLELENRPLTPRVLRALTHLRFRTRGPLGRYPKRWEENPAAPLQSWRLLDQASAARAFLAAAWATRPPMVQDRARQKGTASGF